MSRTVPGGPRRQGWPLEHDQPVQAGQRPWTPADEDTRHDLEPWRDPQRGRPRGQSRPRGSHGRRGTRGPRRRRLRAFLRRPAVRVIGAIFTIFIVWAAFSLGQTLATPNSGSALSKTAEWFRDHKLGALVTFGEWLTYNPPKVGGKPQFSLNVPNGESASSLQKAAQQKARARSSHAPFVPIIPSRLSSPAGTPLPGEGEWRVLETVHGQPAIFGTFLRGSATYSSYVNGIVSIDQRLVKFQLHPGAEDPGPGNWGEPPWIPPGSRTGLLATFNGGFKLNVSGGGFYLNGVTHGTLTPGAASVVYYKNGTIKVGQWDQGVSMNSSVVGVRQNLKLIVDHGKIPSSVNSNVTTAWGATLGGGYYVWRSGIGITADGRIIYAYGPALDVQTLADLLQRAGAVEGMQLDINPYWMSFEYYNASKHPTDPTPKALLPTQQTTAYRYYSVYSRDFTAVYAR